MHGIDRNGRGEDVSVASAGRLWRALMIWGARMGCHQLPERSFFFHGCQFPVCARCTGVLVSTFLGAVGFFCYRISVPAAIGLASVMLLDWSLQFLGILESSNFRRLVTGVVGGFGLTTLYMYIYLAVYRLLVRWLG